MGEIHSLTKEPAVRSLCLVVQILRSTVHVFYCMNGFFFLDFCCSPCSIRALGVTKNRKANFADPLQFSAETRVRFFRFLITSPSTLKPDFKYTAPAFRYNTGTQRQGVSFVRAQSADSPQYNIISLIPIFGYFWAGQNSTCAVLEY